MKRIMFILISIAIFFTACVNNQNNTSESLSETVAPTQIDPEEEFGGVLFEMTIEEVINTIGSQPDIGDQTIGLFIYNNLVFLNVKTSWIEYRFKDDKLTSIEAWYKYQGISETEQLLIDYRAIQKELLKRYPGETNVSGVELTDFYYINTKNRDVAVFCNNNTISVNIQPTENTETIDHSKNFDRITFGMTKEKVIEIVGRQPDKELDFLGIISYNDELCYNVGNASILYGFNDHDMLNQIQISYLYLTGSEEEQLSIDFVTIKEALLNSYPEETRKDFRDEGTELSFYVGNTTYVTLSSESDVDSIKVTIENKYR